MLVKVEQLEKGDEIIIPHGSEFIHIKVIRPARLLYVKDKDKNRILKLDRSGKQMYGNIWGSTNAEIKEWDTTYFWDTTIRHHRRVKFIFNPTEHNHEQYFKLNYCHIFLLNRKL